MKMMEEIEEDIVFTNVRWKKRGKVPGYEIRRNKGGS
jgi:hypothetical protein